MKLNRMFIAALLGFSMLTTSALACDHSSGSSSSQESHWSFFGWGHHSDEDSHHRESDMNGQNTGTGRNCDHGKGNGGGYCGTGGSTSSGGGTSTGSTGSSSGSTGKGISN